MPAQGRHDGLLVSFSQFRAIVILKDVAPFILACGKGSDLCQSRED